MASSGETGRTTPQITRSRLRSARKSASDALGSPLVSSLLCSLHAVPPCLRRPDVRLEPTGRTLEAAPGLQMVQAFMGGRCKGCKGASTQRADTAARRRRAAAAALRPCRVLLAAP